MRKKTHDEYVAEVKTKNSNIEVIGLYIDTHTKIKHRCKIDKHEWNVSPLSILRGTGCPICGAKSTAKKQSKTHDQYVAEVSIVNPNIEVVGKYINAKTKLRHRCKLDGYEWEALPTNICRGKGCPMCSNHIQYGVDEFKRRLYAVNPYIEVIGNYRNTRSSVLCRCLIDGYEWMGNPTNLLKGVGCPMCAGKAPYTTEGFIEKMLTINDTIKIIGQYVNIKTKILCRCMVDGCEWNGLPSNLLKGEGCPKCGTLLQTKKRTKSHEQYVQEVADINPDIEVVGTYVNSGTPILHRCKIDNTRWMVTPDSILAGTGCPCCKSSHGERETRLYLERKHIEYTPQYTFQECRNINPLPFDFYLPKYNLCIEYDGLQHFEPIDFFGGEEGFRQRIINDEIKNRFCDNNHISLLRIRYDEDVVQVLDGFFRTIQND